MQATFGLHWWRFSTPVRDVEAVLDRLGGIVGPVEHRGGFNQPARFLHESGAGVYFGSRVEAQPIVVDVPGEACELLSIEELCGWCEDLGGGVSRVDVAADVEPKEQATSRLLQMRRTFRRGGCDTRIPSTSSRFYVDDSPDGGRTLYVGQPSSSVMLRAYDRRGPLRLEWQLKPERGARGLVASNVARYGAAGIWRQLARKCVWPMPWYQQLLVGESTDLVASPDDGDDLARLLHSLITQLGPTFHALQLLGVNFADLAVTLERPNAQQIRRWAAFAKQAAALGYDGSKLQAEVERWRRSKSKPG